MTQDELLERDIEAAYQAFLAAKERADMDRHMNRMRELVAKRSPQQVKWMEKKMGLST